MLLKLRRILLFSVIVGLAQFSGFSFAKDAKIQGQILVSFHAQKSEDLWVARTFQEGVKSYISGFPNLVILEPSEKFRKCESEECRQEELKLLNVDFYWNGIYEDGKLNYQIQDVASKETLKSGKLTLGKWLEQDLQVQALLAVRPIVKAGGLIDLRSDQQKTVKTLESPAYLSDWISFSKFAPFLVLFGGLSWALLILKLSRFVLGNFSGLQRIHHSSLFMFLRAYIEVSAAKLFLTSVIFCPIQYLGFRFLVPNKISLEHFFYLVSPILSAATIFILFVINWILCRYLDRKYLQHNQPGQHAKIQHYFQNFSKRLGLDLPEQILKNVEFYISRVDQEIIYGGLGLKTRIIVPNWIVDAAMEYIPRYDAITQQVQQTLYRNERGSLAAMENVSLILPKPLRGGAKGKKSDHAFDEIQIDFGRFKIIEPTIEDFSLRPTFANQSGVWGMVLPNKKGVSVPLISDNLKDLQAVEALLSEHHIQFAKPRMEEDYDDSDPQQKDFMFGLLLRLVGFEHRQETPIMTVLAAVKCWLELLPDRPAKWMGAIGEIYERHLSLYPAFIADSYVALNHGGPHLVQMLYFFKTRNAEKLTSRSERSFLVQRSNQVIRWFASQDPAPEDLHRSRATLRNRVLWISSFFHYQLSPKQLRSRWPWKTTLASSSLAAILGMQVYSSYTFHPIYLERISDLEKRIEKYDKEQKEKSERAQAPSLTSPEVEVAIPAVKAEEQSAKAITPDSKQEVGIKKDSAKEPAHKQKQNKKIKTKNKKKSATKRIHK